MSQIKCEMCGGYHHPMVACHEKELTQLQSVVMEMGQEIHKLKATLRDEPCDECGVNTLALLKECDELKRLLAEKNETANIFMRQVKEAHDIIWDMCRNLDAADYARARKFVGLDTEATAVASSALLGVTIGDCHLINADCLMLPWIDADALISDPPYGIAYCHGARKGGVKLGTDGEAIIGDDKPFDPRPWLGYPIVVLWGANHYANRLPNSSRWLIWDKREGIPSNDQADGETAWTNQNGVLRLKTRYWNGAQAKEKDEPRIHSNQKPVGLMAWCMEQVGVPVGATVLDPYMGSGTTGIACIRTGRKFIGVEKDKRHFDNAVDRIRREIQGALL